MELFSFETGLTHGGKGFLTYFFSYREQGVCRKPGCKNRGRGTTGRCPSKIFLLPFIKHAVLNGQTAHTIGCLENRCGRRADVQKRASNFLTFAWALSLELSIISGDIFF